MKQHLLLLAAWLIFCGENLKAVESITIDSPDVVAKNDWSFGGTINTDSASGIIVSVYLDGSASASGSTPRPLPAYAKNWSVSLDLSALPPGPHTATAKVTNVASPSTILSTSTQIFSLDRVKPHIYAKQVELSGLGYSAKYYTYNESRSFIRGSDNPRFFSKVEIFSSSENLKSMTLVIQEYVNDYFYAEDLFYDGAFSEIPQSLAAPSAFNYTTGTITFNAANSTIGAPSRDFQIVARSIVYSNRRF